MSEKSGPRRAKKQEKQDAFISHYLRNGKNERATCRALGIGRSTVDDWKRGDPTFKDRLAEREVAVDKELEGLHQIIRDMLPQAIKAATFDPTFLKHAMQVLYRDQWDVQLARERALRELDKAAPKRPIQIMFSSEPRPERMTEAEDKEKDAA